MFLRFGLTEDVFFRDEPAVLQPHSEKCIHRELDALKCFSYEYIQISCSENSSLCMFTIYKTEGTADAQIALHYSQRVE